jgi:hypothetical protein
MKLVKNLLMSVAACGLIAGTALAATGQSDSATGTVGASIECAISIDNVTPADPGGLDDPSSDLEFGEIVLGAGQTGGDVTVHCDGSPVTYGAMLTPANEPADEFVTPHPANFAVSAEGAEEVSLTITPCTIVISNGTATMNVDTLTVCSTCPGVGEQWFQGPPNDDGSSSCTWNANLAGGPGCVCGNFNLGGTLHVADGQASGLYTGTFTATVTYT